MARSTLVPVDFTDRSGLALRAAAAHTATDGEIILLHAIDPSSLGHLAEAAFAAGLPFADQSIIEDCAIHLRQLRDSCPIGSRSVRLEVRQGPAATEILRVIVELRPDLVVFALDDPSTEPDGLTASLGHLVRTVIDATACPALVVSA